MKQWFPFTDYDFYGFLACGLVFLFALDYWHGGGHYLFHDNWTFLQGALAISLAYVAGQIISIPATLLFEYGLARGVLRPPAEILMSSTDQPKWEKWLGRLMTAYYYKPLGSGVRKKILDNAVKQTGLTRVKLEEDVEEIFVPALTAARTNEGVRFRIEVFRNQYSFNRNMAMSGFIAAGLLFERAARSLDNDLTNWAWLAVLLSIGMLLRFLKFYSDFAAEILRNYAYCTPE